MAIALLVLLPCALLWPYRHAGFVADDFFFGPGFSIRSWFDAFFGPWPHDLAVGKAWRPLVVLSYVANGASSAGQPDGYRLLNYFVHGINAALLAWLTRRLTGRGLVGFLGGLLFAIHPIVHESVLWISGRTYPLAAMFALALCVWSADAPRRPAWRQHSIGVALLVGALTSYECAVVLPVVLLCLPWVAWRREQVTWYSVSRFIALYAVTLGVYLVFRWCWLSSFSSDVILAMRASRWVTAPPIVYRLPQNVLLFVLRLLAWPPATHVSDITLNVTGAATTLGVLFSLVGLMRHPSDR